MSKPNALEPLYVSEQSLTVMFDPVIVTVPEYAFPLIVCPLYAVP
jgi:hypothetical protein